MAAHPGECMFSCAADSGLVDLLPTAPPRPTFRRSAAGIHGLLPLAAEAIGLLLGPLEALTAQNGFGVLYEVHRKSPLMSVVSVFVAMVLVNA